MTNHAERELTPDEVDVIKLIRVTEANLNSQLDMLELTEADQDYVAEAKRYAQLAFIFMTMAVIRPIRPTDPALDEQIEQHRQRLMETAGSA